MYKPYSYLEEGGYARAVKSGTHRVYLEVPKSHAGQFVNQDQLSKSWSDALLYFGAWGGEGGHQY